MTDVRDFTFDAGAQPEQLRRAFETFGVVVLKNFLAKDKLSEQRAAVNRLLGIRLQRLGSSLVSDDIDDNLNALVKLDQRHALDIIRAIKDSPFFYAILADTKLADLSKACLNCETLLSIHDIAQFRIDPPNHDERNFEWHPPTSSRM